MSREELLTPRYIVIADYPKSKDKIGAIYRALTEMNVSFYNTYPAIFKRLEWWEHREEKDMPECLKWIYNGVFTKVLRYDLKGERFYAPEDNHFGYRLIYTLPATLEEYQTSLKSNEIK